MTHTTPHPRIPTETVPSVSGSRFFAAVYDPLLRLGERRGMRGIRRRLLDAAHGQVLEIGAGTGLNLPHYPRDLEEIVLTEPAEPMRVRLDARRSRSARFPRIVAAPAEALPFDDASFDTVVSTLVLCTVRDPARALAEVRRVLRPGGRLLFCEHVRSDAPRLARRQDRFAPAWAGFADGCRCNRDTLATMAAQLEVGSVERAEWRGMPSLVRPLVLGHAVA